MIIAVASDNGVEVAPLSDGLNAFVLFEVGRESAVRAGYRSSVTRLSKIDQRAGLGEVETGSDAERAAIVRALSDCSAVVARVIDKDLMHALAGKAIDTFVCGEENVDMAVRQYVASLPGELESRTLHPDPDT